MSTWPRSAALQEVAAPQERIGVEVGHEQGLVEFPGPFGRGVRPGPVDRVEATLRSGHEGGANGSSRGQAGRSSAGRSRAEGRKGDAAPHPTRHRVGVIRTATG